MQNPETINKDISNEIRYLNALLGVFIAYNNNLSKFNELAVLKNLSKDSHAEFIAREILKFDNIKENIAKHYSSNELSTILQRHINRLINYIQHNNVEGVRLELGEIILVLKKSKAELGGQ